jgi:hypothetical protein
MADLVFSSIASSDLPTAQKSAFKKWYERIGGSGRAIVRAKAHVVEGGHAIRQTGESAVVGATLGAIAANRGPQALDYMVKGQSIPVDAVGGVLAMGAAVVFAPSEPSVAVTLRNAGAAAIAIAAYRKTDEFVTLKMAGKARAAAGATKPGAVAHGEEDPIVALARNL